MSDALDPELADALARMTGARDRPRYQLARFAILRAIGLVYAAAFLGATQQIRGLIGEDGLLPAARELERLRALHGAWAILERPTLFLLTGASDAALLAVAWLGLGLAVSVMLGLESAIAMAILWTLQLSLLHVGQVFWGYGWEILLCEAGFLAIFLAPLRTVRPLARAEAPHAVIWLYRWLTFRVMFGAGLIKLRGDACWRELTCLATHYETQPIPSPLSPWLHHRPLWFHEAGVLFNHFVELIVPFFFFGPWWLRWIGGSLTIAFQLMLVASGNLSFLNWLTIAIALSAYDDRLWEALARRDAPAAEPAPRARRVVSWGLVAVVALLSVSPVMNLLSLDQAMNTSYDRLHLVNTYGAFGSVNRVRHELVIEGTLDDPGDASAAWRAYALPCQPGDPMRRPCVRAPYHHRLDWQMWFAAFQDPAHQPWLAHLVWQLLHGEGRGRDLLAHDPFGGRRPRAIRVSVFRYRFARPDEAGWWRRQRTGEYFRVLTADDPDLVALEEAYGW